MAKKIEGALYKMTGKDERLPKGTIVRLTDDDGTQLPFFKSESRDICLNMAEDVKLLKPKKGDTVRLISKKHTTENLSWDDDCMEKKGAEFILLEAIDTKDDTFKHNGFWYHKKDLAVIKRPATLEPIQVAEPVKPKFEDGDIVRVIANTNHSRNEVGDIGVVRLGKFGFMHVDVPSKPDTKDSNGNATHSREIEHLGLKGEIK